ncbi:MAG: hypothetical protein U9R26_11080 [Campylobacterota bacterium]|nr:hypothetical protein [Campylobacterota bacterium]
MLKEMLYTGIGGAMLMKERVEEELKKLEDKGKLSKEDAQQFLDDLKAKGEEEETKLKEQIKEALKEVIEEIGLATKEDIEKLKTDKS